MSTDLKKIDPQIVELLDKQVSDVITSTDLEGFAKAFKMADAIEKLKLALTDDYMKVIMPLMGKSIGFKTDRDKGADVKYSQNEVRDCLIEAVLKGVQPINNQFNIIAGNVYITKEGYQYKLSKIPNLRFKIMHSIPKVDGETAIVTSSIQWAINGNWQKEELPLCIKINKGQASDAILGKADRKAKHWLYSTITGFDLGDADVNEDDINVSKGLKDKFAAGSGLLDAAAKIQEEEGKGFAIAEDNKSPVIDGKGKIQPNQAVLNEKQAVEATPNPAVVAENKSTREQNLKGLFDKDQ